ncbi:MAG TPA: hypothetical protein VGQ76_19775 [Thermoanaerobaculia bacterium]|jgi:hypothetical protein|nr:hypothetical protein [Thermoanaerobaculia bacterium]
MNVFVHTALALALSIVSFTSVAAQETVTGTALPRATLTELALLPMREPAARDFEHRSLIPSFRTFVAEVQNTGFESTAATIAPPPVALKFDSSTSRVLSPADASGAVGKNHVVGAYNSGVTVHDRAGNKAATLTLQQFWAGVTTTQGDIYDPRIVYDSVADRFVLTSIHNGQFILLGFTETGDPTGAWRRYRITANGVDFSQLAVTKDTVMFGTNVEPFSVIYLIQKEALYAGPANPTFGKMQVTAESDLLPVGSEDSTIDYVVMGSGSQILVNRLDTPSQPFRVITSPTTWLDPNWQLPQLNGGPLDAGWGVIASAVERNGFIYVAMTRTAPGATRQSIVWCRFDPVTLVSEWGSISDPSGEFAYAYPSVAVNRTGAMLIGFGKFSPNRYPSSAYIYRDILGRISTVADLHLGESAFTASERWGDYTTTLVDPVNPNTFWTVQIHAKESAWHSAWGRIDVDQGRRRAARH